MHISKASIFCLSELSQRPCLCSAAYAYTGWAKLNEIEISVENRIFPHPVYFEPSLKKFPLELGTGAGSQKTRMMQLPDRTWSLTISLSVWIQCINVTHWRRYQTTAKSKDRAYASVGFSGVAGVKTSHTSCITVIHFLHHTLLINVKFYFGRRRWIVTIWSCVHLPT